MTSGHTVVLNFDYSFKLGPKFRLNNFHFDHILLANNSLYIFCNIYKILMNDKWVKRPILFSNFGIHFENFILIN